VERIAERHGFGPWKRKFSGLAADGELAGQKVLLLKPQTYMNDSGQSVGEAVRFLKLGEGDVVVFHDEIDLAPGKLKVKTGGGNAGHNGLRSLTAHVGNEYCRVRIGVGHPGVKELVHGWVLRDFAKADRDWLEPLLDAMADAAGRLAKGDEARFLTDVARQLREADEAPEVKVKVVESASRTKSASAQHPAGERQAKRRSALAANLKSWFAGRNKKQS
jgi:PTH1 family peptidyl-tRNA hydrolase